MLGTRCRVMLALAVVVGLVPHAAQAQDKYKVRLTTVPMDGGMRANVAGSGSGTASLAGAKLTINGTFDGRRTPATGAQVLLGRAGGVRGAAIGQLTVTKATQGTVGGTIDLTPQQVDGLKHGQLYVQIASEKAPDGNLWGWIL